MVFKTAAGMNAVIKRYFAECEETGAPPAVCDLALALGFESRLDLLRYKGKPAYMKIIKRALLTIEGFTERKLMDRGCYSGAKFSLSNNFKGWSDKPDGNDTENLEKLDEILARMSEKMKE